MLDQKEHALVESRTTWPQRARAIMGNSPWPYGAQSNPVRDNLIVWAETRGLRYSPNGGCLHWLARGRCGVQICREGHGSRDWMDHVTGWTRNGQPAVLLCQPYHVEDIVDLAHTTNKWGLEIRIHGAGWYGHDSVCIEIWNSQAAYRATWDRHNAEIRGGLK